MHREWTLACTAQDSEHRNKDGATKRAEHGLLNAIQDMARDFRCRVLCSLLCSLSHSSCHTSALSLSAR